MSIQPVLDLFDPPPATHYDCAFSLAKASRSHGLDLVPYQYLDWANFEGLDLTTVSDDIDAHLRAQAFSDAYEKRSVAECARDLPANQTYVSAHARYFLALTENGERRPLRSDRWCFFAFAHRTLGIVDASWKPSRRESGLLSGHVQYWCEGFPWDSHYFNLFPAWPKEVDLIDASIAVLDSYLEEHAQREKERERLIAKGLITA